MKKYIIVLLLTFLASTCYAENIPGRPDIRPLLSKSIVAIVRGFVAGKHCGIDFSCCIDSKVMATGDGEIVCSRFVNGYGNVIIIKHDWVKNKKAYTAYTVYGHLAEFKKIKGMKVLKGDLIALSGNNGRSEGPHLHYELRDANETAIWNGTYQAEKTLEDKIDASKSS